MNKEYIERKAVLLATDILDEYLTDCERLYFVKQIKNIPTADVVEVVRCKDCWKRYKLCFDKTLEDNDFCSYGERKTD